MILELAAKQDEIAKWRALVAVIVRCRARPSALQPVEFQCLEIARHITGVSALATFWDSVSWRWLSQVMRSRSMVTVAKSRSSIAVTFC
jgi:hypothetical protein